MSPKTRGYLFAFLAICIFAGQDATPKYLGDRYPALFITMIRFWAFALFVFGFAATSPGGIAEMSLTAKNLRLGVPIVTAFHVTRMTALVLAIGPLFRLARRIKYWRTGESL